VTTDPFIRHRSRPISLAIAANLGRMVRQGSALGIGLASTGGAAVVIGGGPSCGGFDRIGDALTFCVNTSAPKVCESFAPDVLVVREIVSVADQVARLRHKPRLAAVDIGTAPATIDALEAAGIPVAWIVPAQGILVWLVEALGTRPVYGGTSAMTLAVALTDRIGCDAVTLLGCDLAFGSDGAAYGEGTAWGGTRVDVSGPIVDFGDRGGMREHARQSGITAPPLREHGIPVLMEDGTTGTALDAWVNQREWCEQWARRHPETRFANLSGGAKVEGWPAASKVERALWSHDAATVPLVHLDVSRIDAELRRQIALCRAALDSDRPWTLDLLPAHLLIDLAAARDIGETSDRALPLTLALAERKPIYRRACDAVERAYEGA